MNINEIIETVLAIMAADGIIPTMPLILDGKLHRAHCKGDKAGSLNLAYVIHTDGKPNAWYQHFSTGITGRWTASGRREPITAEMRRHIEAAKATRQKEQETKHKAAARKAAYICKFQKAERHPYSTAKQVTLHGARLYRDALAIPINDETGKLVNVQLISPTGEKRFLAGGRKKGCFYQIGEPTDTILIAEGFATGASLFEATGKAIVIAFDAGNLSPVAKVIRAKYPNAEIIIAGDNDMSGLGQKAANDAALACNGKVLFLPTAGMDWNDHVCNGGRIDG